MARTVALRYLPFAVILSLSGAGQQALTRLLPFLASMHPVDGKAAVYFCANFSCQLPVTTVDQLEAELTEA
jgi:uncharacterized protein YyaL (SSP411 family)